MKKWIILLLLALQVPMLTWAQSNIIRRKVNMAALLALEEYESTFNITDEKYNQFLGQYVSENSLVYNDLLGKSFKSTLTAKEYADLLVNSQELYAVKIMDIKKGDLVRTPDGWEVPVEFKKEVIYTDSLGVLFSSTEFYGAYYDIKINYLYDAEQDRCLIRSIEGNVDSDQKLPEKYDVILRTRDTTKNGELKASSLVYDRVTYNGGKYLRFNSANQAFVPDSLTTRGFQADLQTWEADTYIRKKLDKETGMMSLKANRKTGRIKLRYGMTVGNNAYAITASDYGNVSVPKVSSKSSEYGVDLGLVFGSTKRTKFGLFVGAALNESSMMFTRDTLLVSLTDYETYTAIDRLLNQQQEFKASDISAQAYMNFEHRIINRLSVNWSIGVKGYLNEDFYVGGYTVDKASADRFVGDDGVTYESETSYQSLAFDSFYDREGAVEVTSWPISLVGTLGFNVFITRSIILNLKAGYEYGLSEVVSYTNKCDANNLQTVDNSLVAIAPFVNSFTAKRRGIWIEGGLTFKFF